MLWISAGDDAGLMTEIERRVGLKAELANKSTAFWETLDRYQAVVLKLPVEREIVQQVLKAQEACVVPLLVADPEGTLDESLVRPPMSHFHYITSEDPEEYARVLRTA